MLGGRKAGAKVAPRYRNPSNPDQTWTGRGRKPLWVVDALNSGKSLDDLAI
ncbi:H-NS histone family protein [Roseobacter sp. HKCC-CH-9208]|uniref:H-NS histone family protein n=1 Tax=Roseobacter sp. HKCC-CH-9208 TaxID=3120339 RepID=UPI0040407AA4